VYRKYIAALLVSACFVTRSGAVETPLQADSAMEALQDGNALLRLRPRYIWVNEDTFEAARGGSVRSQLGWETLSWRGLKATVELINLSRIDNHKLAEYGDYSTTYQYSSYQGVLTATPAGYANNYVRLADSNKTDANRIFLEYAGEVTLRAGRFPLSFDDERMVGEYD
jgi:hypothetical protein